jgi:hypothetical protein
LADSPWIGGGRRADAARWRARGGGGARLGTRKEEVLPWASWAMWAAQAEWPTGPKARKEFLLEIK